MIDYSIKYAAHMQDVKTYDTGRLRKEFLIEKIFEENTIQLTYSLYDRFIAGGALPTDRALELIAIDPLKAKYFCDRRELGVINIGGKGTVTVDDHTYELDKKEALYIGKGAQKIIFESNSKKEPALFYLNSAPATCSYPTKHLKLQDAKILELGSQRQANKRRIIQFIVEETVGTCQLQMGVTELEEGSVWNTMPAHTHDRRMEVYFYSNVPEGQAVCHFMGPEQETRHIWVANNQAVISPPWSIHSGAGTSNYFFIWGMAGENMDFTDMDAIPIKDLR